MKKIFLLVAFAGFLFFNQGYAQDAGRGMARTKLGLGVDFAFPVGQFNDEANYGAGGSLLYQHPVAHNLNITGNIGYIRFNGKEGILANVKYREGFVPIKAGARYFIAENIYGAAEAGISISTADGSGSGTSFIYSPSLGVEFPVSDKGSVDVGLRYESWARSNGTLSFVGIRAGYNF